MRNKEKDAAQIAQKKERIIDEGFRLFAEKGINNVTIPQIAAASGVSRAAFFHYFPSKLDLVVAISVRKWGEYISANNGRLTPEEQERMSGAEHLRWYMDSFLDLYRNHRDILCFNYEFNSFLRSELTSPEQKYAYMQMVDELGRFFHDMYEKGMRDGSLRKDISEEAMFSSSFHIMLAAVTRYAVGLVYVLDQGSDPESELEMLKELLLSRYTVE
ncbi:MAG: TetR/AcrR family transcriptional regulator [Anaerolineaceae bacterium]|nr:TetR/AcrR family transcriptional regulator [Anaerolineaceae bacterium]